MEGLACLAGKRNHHMGNATNMLHEELSGDMSNLKLTSCGRTDDFPACPAVSGVADGHRNCTPMNAMELTFSSRGTPGDEVYLEKSSDVSVSDGAPSDHVCLESEQWKDATRRRHCRNTVDVMVHDQMETEGTPEHSSQDGVVGCGGAGAKTMGLIKDNTSSAESSHTSTGGMHEEIPNAGEFRLRKHIHLATRDSEHTILRHLK